MDLTETIDALLSAVPDLKASLDGIGDKPWSETRESMDPLDRAKMDVLMAYAINDLIWVYLKLKGVDPATHQVTQELDRIKKYYSKIKAAEDPSQRTRIDKDAAHRFVLAGIPRSQRLEPSSSTSQAGATAPEIGQSGDTSLAGRYRFLSDQGEKVLPDENDDSLAIHTEKEDESMGDDSVGDDSIAECIEVAGPQREKGDSRKTDEPVETTDLVPTASKQTKNAKRKDRKRRKKVDEAD